MWATHNSAFIIVTCSGLLLILAQTDIQTDEDALTNVSGFYGPGACAAWLVMVLSNREFTIPIRCLCRFMAGQDLIRDIDFTHWSFDATLIASACYPLTTIVDLLRTPDWYSQTSDSSTRAKVNAQFSVLQLTCVLSSLALLSFLLLEMLEPYQLRDAHSQPDRQVYAKYHTRESAADKDKPAALDLSRRWLSIRSIIWFTLLNLPMLIIHTTNHYPLYIYIGNRCAVQTYSACWLIFLWPRVSSLSFSPPPIPSPNQSIIDPQTGFVSLGYGISTNVYLFFSQKTLDPSRPLYDNRLRLAFPRSSSSISDLDQLAALAVALLGLLWTSGEEMWHGFKRFWRQGTLDFRFGRNGGGRGSRGMVALHATNDDSTERREWFR